MIPRFRFVFGQDPMWRRVVAISLALFFIYLSDAIYSYWVPVTVEKSLGGSLIMGLVISFQSISGLIADILIPQMLRGTNVKTLVIYGIGANLLFGAILSVTVLRPWVLIWLLGMAVWGVYYEMLGFANQQFIAETAPVEQRSGVWALMRVFSALAYLLGPIIASALIIKGGLLAIEAASILTVIGAVFFWALRLKNKPVEIELSEINVYRELEHWWVLLKHVWPVILVSLLIGLIDATFWTVGAVWSQTLTEKSWLGSLFLPMYTLPALFMGYVVMKWNVYKGKKRKGIKFMIAAGIILAGLALRTEIWWQLGVVLIASCLLAVTYPLIDAVYTDILARMGRERKHLMGLSGSTINLAYIGGPILVGLVAQIVGTQMTFAIIGGAVALVGVLLLLVMPRKIKLPQVEIHEWHDGEAR